MLFNQRFWSGLRDGSITIAYRRWKRPTVKAGGTLQSPAGQLAIDEVDRVTATDIDEAAARVAGYNGRAELIANLRPEGDLYRIRFHRLGDDPRIAMRQKPELSDVEQKAVDRLLQRQDWALAYLRLIDEMSAVVSTELAAKAGIARPAFKQRVRRLKELGLTESLEVGYRLSPRGAAILASVDRPR